MGYAARANGGWRKAAPWQGIAHPHAGHYGLMAVLVSGVPEGRPRVIVDIGVGPEGRQQHLLSLTVESDGRAMLPHPVNLRDGVALWFRSSHPDVVAATTTADVVHRSGPPGLSPRTAAVLAIAQRRRLVREAGGSVYEESKA